jgi:hypothetical protein
MTYAINDSALSGRDKSVLGALAKILKTGESIKITGFAYRDATLARKRAAVVANFLKNILEVHIAVAIITTSKVGKVTVTTNK